MGSDECISEEAKDRMEVCNAQRIDVMGSALRKIKKLSTIDGRTVKKTSSGMNLRGIKALLQFCVVHLGTS